MPRKNHPTLDVKIRDAEMHRKYILEHPLTPEQRSRKIEQERARYNRDLESNRLRCRERKRKQRQKAFDLLGGACTICGSRYAITFDHINGDGTRERKSGEGNNIEVQILAGRKDIRILCFSCNHLARKDVYGPDIALWPTEVLVELQEIKRWRAEVLEKNEQCDTMEITNESQS